MEFHAAMREQATNRRMLRVNLIIGLSTAVITLVTALVGLRFVPTGPAVAIVPNAEVTVSTTVTEVATATVTATVTEKVTETAAATEPLAAEPAATTAAEVVSEPGTVFLTDLRPTESFAWEADTVSINGDPYTHGIALMRWEYSEGSVEYTLDQRHAFLQADLGVNDKADTDCVVKFEIYGNGKLLAARTARYTEVKPIKIPIANMVKIKVAATGVDGDCTISGGAAVVGDAVFTS